MTIGELLKLCRYFDESKEIEIYVKDDGTLRDITHIEVMVDMKNNVHLVLGHGYKRMTLSGEAKGNDDSRRASEGPR